MSSIVPYSCIFIDSKWKDIFTAVKECMLGCHNRDELINNLIRLWTTIENNNYVLPCLSVRSGFDLFLKICNFPHGSEVIISAINIPDMVSILKHHGLKIIPLDIDIDTTEPKFDILPSLMSDNTKLLILTHIYGKMFDVTPYIDYAHKNGMVIIEDCAEGFGGFDNIGHPDSDLVMFSFGLIKYYTSFGGAVLKIKNIDIYNQMVKVHDTYPIQSNRVYLEKLIKYTLIHTIINKPPLTRVLMMVAQKFGYDYQRAVVDLMRGFPQNLIRRIRYRPSTSLLYMMLYRQTSFTYSDFQISYLKGRYITEKLPIGITQVGTKASNNNYWLFPIVVDNPDDFVKTLNDLGVDAYRGATQLNIIEPENGQAYMKHLLTNLHDYPHEARYLIDHVVYLPVHKQVPFHALDAISTAVSKALTMVEHQGSSVGSHHDKCVKSKL